MMGEMCVCVFFFLNVGEYYNRIKALVLCEWKDMEIWFGNFSLDEIDIYK